MCIYATGVYFCFFFFCSYLISSRFVESTKMLCGFFLVKGHAPYWHPKWIPYPKGPERYWTWRRRVGAYRVSWLSPEQGRGPLPPHCLDGPCIHDMYINRWHISYIIIYPYIYIHIFSPWSFVPVGKFCECRKLHECPIFPLAYWRDRLLGWFW